jgi:hypothetical protein
MATSKGALITSMLAQLTVAEETKDPKQRKRAMGALRRLLVELDDAILFDEKGYDAVFMRAIERSKADAT